MSPRTCSADTPVREKLEARVTKAILAAIVRSFAVLMEALQEIFDESAYERFLIRTRLQSSPDAYAIFRRENEQAKLRRPRCC
jgi:hypothetical protein